MTPEQLVGGLGTVAGIIAYAATWTAALTPQASPASPRWWQYARPVLDWIAANKFNAVNAPPGPLPPPAVGPGSVISITKTLNQ